jgi:hypothetical protein
VYNDWIDKSLEKLAESVPMRYDKPEESSEVVSSLETFIFAFAKPAASVPPVTTDSIVAEQPKPSGPIEDIEPGEVVQNAVPAPSDAAGELTDTWVDQPPAETNTEADENVQVMVSDPRVETSADQSVPGIVEAAPEIQVAESATTSELVLWVDENVAHESDVQEGSPEVKIP